MGRLPDYCGRSLAVFHGYEGILDFHAGTLVLTGNNQLAASAWLRLPHFRNQPRGPIGAFSSSRERHAPKKPLRKSWLTRLFLRRTIPFRSSLPPLVSAPLQRYRLLPSSWVEP